MLPRRQATAALFAHAADDYNPGIPSHLRHSMRDRLQHTAAVIALAAMLLRALIPVGWMPSSQPGTPLAFCTAGGLVELPGVDATSLPDTPAPDNHSAADEPHCAFAGAAPALRPATNCGTAAFEPSHSPSVPFVEAMHHRHPVRAQHPARAPPVPSSLA